MSLTDTQKHSLRGCAAATAASIAGVIVPLVGGAPPNSVFDYQALRVSPNVYTTLSDIDTFCDAVEKTIRSGLAA